MGRPSDWVREVTGRAPMRSPGAPGHPRSKERDFWEQISTGKLPREAADAVDSGASGWSAVWAGIDSGKWTHHCVVIDQSGTVSLSKRVEDDEAALLDLIETVIGIADVADG